MSKEFAGKVVVIIGGAMDIRRATALLLAEAGALFIIADVDWALGEETAKEAKRRGGVRKEFASESVVKRISTQAFSFMQTEKRPSFGTLQSFGIFLRKPAAICFE